MELEIAMPYRVGVIFQARSQGLHLGNEMKDWPSARSVLAWNEAANTVELEVVMPHRVGLIL